MKCAWPRSCLSAASLAARLAGLIEGAGRAKRLTGGAEILLLDVVADITGHSMKGGMQFAGFHGDSILRASSANHFPSLQDSVWPIADKLSPVLPLRKFRNLAFHASCE
mgnify:CR=1 FL=1